jgi:CYTH domain-containing protein
MIEIERTFLVRELPPDLKDCKSVEIVDIYIPGSAEHPKIRIRRTGNVYELTKKEPVGEDASHQTEHTISLTKEEFEELSKLNGKRLRKIRYYYPFEGRIAEIDVFQEELSGLVVADFEFKTREERDSFNPPGFCLADITQESFIAGGRLCGKSYQDIRSELERFRI